MKAANWAIGAKKKGLIQTHEAKRMTAISGYWIY
jgi:hypothetical protein